MKILITGAAGFLGRNLAENLKCIRDGKNRTRPALRVEEIYEYTRASLPEELELWCEEADFVFHLAGVNRPKDPEEYREGNFGFTSVLLETLKRKQNPCPVLLASSIQASLAGRFENSEYGRSKLAGEELLFDYARETGAKALVYRFPNLAGKWIRPNYNSAVATFCYNIARDLPITVNDPSVELELLFVEDLLEEFYDALEGHPHRANYDGLTPIPNPAGRFCRAPVTHRATLGEITELLYGFRKQPETLLMPALAPDSLGKKLYSMYLSYLPPEKVVFDLEMHCDSRGSFTEFLKTAEHGQVSVNISEPGVTKGRHWHNSKWEFFLVVSGRGLIRERKLGTEETLEFSVSGEKLQAVHMLPGYTHEIINLSQTEKLITLMWANELFDPQKPDTYYEPVLPEEEREK